MLRFLAPFVLVLLATGPVCAQLSLTADEEDFEGADEELAPPPAQGDQLPPGATMTPIITAANPRGHYVGVKPGGKELPAVGTVAGSLPAVVTWPGFQMRKDGGSRVFLQLSAPVDVAYETRPDKVILDLQGARIAGRNNRHHLDTRFFNTPVLRATLKRDKGVTTLEVALRSPAQPRISNQPSKSGYHFLYIDFPKGDYLPKAAPKAPAGGEGAAPAVEDVPAPPPSAPRSPTHLPGGDLAPPPPPRAVGGQAAISTEMDDELPPGMGKVRLKGKAKVGGDLRLER